MMEKMQISKRKFYQLTSQVGREPATGLMPLFVADAGATVWNPPAPQAAQVEQGSPSAQARSNRTLQKTIMGFELVNDDDWNGTGPKGWRQLRDNLQLKNP